MLHVSSTRNKQRSPPCGQWYNDIPLTADERTVLRRQKDVRRAKLGRLADTADGSRRVVPFLHLVLVHRSGLERGPDGYKSAVYHRTPRKEPQASDIAARTYGRGRQRLRGYPC